MDRARIVVVADDPTVADVVTRHLERKGCAVASGGDVRLAPETAIAEPPGLVVLDVTVAGMDDGDVGAR